MGWWSDLLSNPTLDRSGMEAKDNGKRKGDWLQPITEWISDVIPNEVTKTDNMWVSNVPYLGWAWRGVSAADNFSETYSNTGDLGASTAWGARGIMGQASDPYMYSPKNQAGYSDDWALNIGKTSNAVYGAYKGGDFGGVGGLFSNYDESATGYYPMTGVGVGTDQDPNVNGQGSGWSSLLGMAGSYFGNKYGGGMGSQLGGNIGSSVGSRMNVGYQNAYSSSPEQPLSSDLDLPQNARITTNAGYAPSNTEVPWMGVYG
jgi:hypothetical protein